MLLYNDFFSVAQKIPLKGSSKICCYIMIFFCCTKIPLKGSSKICCNIMIFFLLHKNSFKRELQDMLLGPI